MTAREYNKRNRQRIDYLLNEELSSPPITQKDKDIFNLKYMLYNIGHGSLYFRSRCVSTLQRAIKTLDIDFREV